MKLPSFSFKFRDFKIGKKVILGYSVILTLMVIIAAIVTSSVSSLIDTFEWVDHTQNVIGRANNLIKLMVDMETGERGFLIAGKDEYLEPYEQGIVDFDKGINELKELVNDNPSQVARMERVHTLQKRWLEVAAGPEIAERRKVVAGAKDANYLEEVLARGVGKGILDNLRIAIEGLTANLERANNLRGIILAISMAKDMVDRETGQRGFLITGKDEFLDPYRNGKQNLTKHVGEIRRLLARQSANLRRVDDIVRLAAEWEEKAAAPEIGAREEMNRSEATMDDVVALIEAGTGKGVIDELRGIVAEFIGIEQGLMEERKEEAANVSTTTIVATIGSTVIAIVLGILLSLFITKAILAPVKQMTDILTKIDEGEGDLTIRLGLDAKDEIGIMAGLFDSFISKLHDIIKNIRGGVEQVSKASTQISSASEELAAGAEEQQAQLSEVATTMEQMSAMILESSKNAEETRGSAQGTGTTATQGREVVTRTVKGFETMAKTVEQAASQIQELSRRSEEIGNVIQVIDDIADQTNLLALNANIEAARAGDAGRGFAVVADEVRKLAERTVSATAEIGKMIETIQNDIQTAVRSMANIQSQSQEGLELVNESDQSLENISSSIETVISAVEQIATATNEQSSGAEEISKNIEGVTTVAKESASSAQQMASSAEQLNREVEGLNTLISQFKVKADK